MMVFIFFTIPHHLLLSRQIRLHSRCTKSRTMLTSLFLGRPFLVSSVFHLWLIRFSNWRRKSIKTFCKNISGHFSWRNTSNGSWFIQSLVEVFETYANMLDVLSMMTYVNRIMILNYESYCPSKKCKKREKYISCWKEASATDFVLMSNDILVLTFCLSLKPKESQF